MNKVIEVENIGKKYFIRHEMLRYATLRDAIAQSAQSMGRRIISGQKEAASTEEFWALKDVSFSVSQGDRLGIIGRNGAGKSTLLKVISRITEPTTGRIKLRGRVASLLEVGTGFHQELTGRENIFLNGAILGMGKEEIKKKFEEIVHFAEVEQFLDTPVKRFSSGMYVRLAFAVAAHLEPEILIVDEVLAVGDAQFQKKCLGKMEEVGREGRTILFVSHNMSSVNMLCNRVCLLEKGSSKMEGPSSEVIKFYLQSNNNEGTASQLYEDNNAPGNDSVRLRAVRVTALDGQTRGLFNLDEEIVLEVEFDVSAPLANFHTVMDIYTMDGIHAFSSASWDKQGIDSIADYKPGTYVARCKIPPFMLNTGAYYLNVSGQLRARRPVYHVENAVQWELSEIGYSGIFKRRQGIFGPMLSWSVHSGGE
jgi:lipopolysaccharide transport system ATP-binding protein